MNIETNRIHVRVHTEKATWWHKLAHVLQNIAHATMPLVATLLPDYARSAWILFVCLTIFVWFWAFNGFVLYIVADTPEDYQKGMPALPKWFSIAGDILTILTCSFAGWFISAVVWCFCLMASFYIYAGFEAGARGDFQPSSRYRKQADKAKAPDA